jgi:hypothetical protein
MQLLIVTTPPHLPNATIGCRYGGVPACQAGDPTSRDLGSNSIECISADGRSLLPMVIWPATTHRRNWTTHPTPGWHYACSESGYTDSYISLEWLKRVFDPQTRERAGEKPRILIWDGFGTHQTLEILEFCFKSNIRLCRIPSHTSHKLQPCDVGVFGPLKSAYRDEAELLWRGGANTVGKEHFTFLYGPARSKALTCKNIKAGWAKAGLFPFNPNRVLRDIQKPSPEQTLVNSDNVMENYTHEEVLQTPVTAEGFVSLHRLIKQDVHAHDEESKQRLQRRLEKFARAGQLSLAECALLQDENQLLFKQNDEAKRRKSNKSTVVGKARVMSYEDIVIARDQRAAKDDSVTKRKSGRKRASTASTGAKAKRTRRSEVEAAEDEIVAGGMEDYCSVFQT